MAGSGLEVLSPLANLADYHGKTLFVSETVEYTSYSHVLLSHCGVWKDVEWYVLIHLEPPFRVRSSKVFRHTCINFEKPRPFFFFFFISHVTSHMLN